MSNVSLDLDVTASKQHNRGEEVYKETMNSHSSNKIFTMKSHKLPANSVIRKLKSQINK